MADTHHSMLIVDDDADILKVFKEIFELRGWKIFTAPIGTSALAIVETEKIDIVLLDIKLPGKSGIEVLKEIKEKKANLPVIIVTGLGYEDDLVEKALQEGASGYVSKGVSIQELIGVIQNVLPTGR